mmetsp:Transcript_37651/g.122015  ORF Transcript_37651/g.122015 Transcript_37651/m.122015 type:complete len:499 (+) Transcript_37651:320-1816(+)
MPLPGRHALRRARGSCQSLADVRLQHHRRLRARLLVRLSADAALPRHQVVRRRPPPRARALPLLCRLRLGPLLRDALPRGRARRLPPAAHAARRPRTPRHRRALHGRANRRADRAAGRSRRSPLRRRDGARPLREGVFLLDGASGAAEALAALAGANFGLLAIAALTFRLPEPTAPHSLPPAEGRPGGRSAAPGGGESGSGGGAEGGGGLDLAAAQRTPQLWLLAGGTLGLSMAGLPFLSVGKLMMSDLGSAAAAAAVAGGAATGAVGAAAATAAVAGYPQLISSANMGGRLLWGPIGDAAGCGRTLCLVGIALPACLLAGMPLATRALAGGADPETALTLFRAATCVNVGAYAGVPVLLAPATADLFGSADAAAIYQRIGATITFASPLGAAVCTRLRDGAYAQHAAALTELCDEATFAATFGAPPAALEQLLASKAVTLPLLLHIAPEGTPDPTPLLYDGAFCALGSCAALACACNAAAFALPRPYGGSRREICRR